MNGIDANTLGIYNIAAAGIQSLGAIGAAVTSYHSSKRLMKLQNDYNVANWNLQNEYNSPVAQRQRLQEANLNPNLVYGNGNAITPAQTIQGPSNHQFKVDTPNFLAAFSLGLQRAQLKLQEKVANSTVRENESRANYYDALERGQNIDNADKEVNFELMNSEFEDPFDYDENSDIVAWKGVTARELELGYKMALNHRNYAIKNKEIIDISAKTDLTRNQIYIANNQFNLLTQKFDFDKTVTREKLNQFWKQLEIAANNSETQRIQVNNMLRLGLARVGLDSRRLQLLENLNPLQMQKIMAEITNLENYGSNWMATGFKSFDNFMRGFLGVGSDFTWNKFAGQFIGNWFDDAITPILQQIGN